MTPTNSPYYNKQGLWLLFLICAFPFLFWTLILSFRDVSWMIERTNVWDAVGVIAYGLIFALIESAIFFIVVTLLGFLVLRSWGVERRVALLGMLALVVALWAMVDQVYFLSGVAVPALFLQFIIDTGRSLLTIYFFASAVVILSVVIPTYFILRSEKFLLATQVFMERLSTLTAFYLLLVFVGLVIVTIRNI